MACITVTNVSPPDRFQFLFAKCCATAVPRRLRIDKRSCDLAYGTEACLWFRRSFHLLLATLQGQHTADQILLQNEIFGRDRNRLLHFPRWVAPINWGVALPLGHVVLPWRISLTRSDMVGRVVFRVDGISSLSFPSVLDLRSSCGRSVCISSLRSEAGSSR
jgi:hypothetical protein